MTKKKSKDSLGDRMKDIEGRCTYYLPRRCYTIIRLDGAHFHTFLKRAKKPFDRTVMDCMQKTTLALCKQIPGVKIGYTQSDEITLILTDFDTIKTQAWFDGNISKIISTSAAMATAEFNKQWLSSKLSDMWDNLTDYSYVMNLILDTKSATFDSRVYTTSDPWEAFNSLAWRISDASKNSIQMIAQSLYSHKELQGKGFAQLNELLFQKGHNFNDYPTDCKRGAFVIKLPDQGWIIDKDAPLPTQDQHYIMDRLPLIPAPTFEREKERWN